MHLQRRWVHFLILLLVCVSFISLPAARLHAQVPGVTGTYTVQDTDGGGKTSTATLTISQSGDIYQFTWKTSQASAQGFGILEGDTISAAFGDPKCGIAVYKIADNGDLQGHWALPGDTQLKTENGTIVSQNNGSSKLNIVGTTGTGGQYSGTLDLTPNGQEVNAVWHAPDETHGVGVVVGHVLAITYGAPACGVVTFQINANGSLSGQYTDTDNPTKVGTEQAVLAGNSSSGGDGTSAGNPTTRSPATLTIGNEATVTDAGNELYLMSSPSLGSKRITVLLSGDPVLLMGGPIQDSSNLMWWQVRLIDGHSGYVVQGYSGTDWITPSTGANQVNPDNFETNLYMGARATLGTNSTYAVVARDQPSAGAQALKRIDNQSIIVVIMGGPVIAEQKRWWQVRLGGDNGPDAQDSRMGWIAEDSQAYLEPLYPVDSVMTVKGGSFTVGSNVRATSSGTDMRVRRDPSVTSPAFTTYGPGVDATVVGGPITAESFIWWELRLPDGTTGWTATAPGWLESYNG